ncbi:hypothetical protein NDU88_002716 [Pleurodeles waltl]|uniref:Uncharacterized protein n=1 Tax=Pleurodeles waltl TaxID=8319 RepID=A0AAV7PAU7_PLEWA|nr:hypothetical protein NDU88_002716 [Pleurodeles waltl]
MRTFRTAIPEVAAHSGLEGMTATEVRNGALGILFIIHTDFETETDGNTGSERQRREMDTMTFKSKISQNVALGFQGLGMRPQCKRVALHVGKPPVHFPVARRPSALVPRMEIK